MTLDMSLAQLEQAQLVRRLASQDEPALGAGYQFKHVLTQEAAYRSLPRRQRQEIHRQVAACYEQLFAGRLEEHAAELAFHFGEAGDDAKVLVFSLMAGDAALRVYATAEAGMHYAQAREAVQRGAPAAADQLRTLFIRRGQAMELESRFTDAMENYRELEQLAAGRNDSALELAALLAQTKLRSFNNPLYDPGAGRVLAERGLALAAQLDDQRSQAEIYWNLMNQARFDVGRLAAAVEYGEQALAIAQSLGWNELAAYINNDLADVYGEAGRSADALSAFAAARELWQQSGNQPMLADNLTSTGLWRAVTGDFEAGLAAIDEGHAMSQRIQNIWGLAYSLGMRGIPLWQLGEYGRAIDDFTAGAALADKAGFLVGQVLPRLQLALIYYELGAPELGLPLVRDVADRAREMVPQFTPAIQHLFGFFEFIAGDHDKGGEYLDLLQPVGPEQGAFVSHFANLVRIEMALLGDRPGEALSLCRTHLPVMREAGLLTYTPGVLISQAVALRRLGRVDEARADLYEAAALARQLKQRRILWCVLPALAELTPDEAEARALWAEARDVIQFVAGRLPDGPLRASFLSLPAVHSALDIAPNIPKGSSS